MNARVINRCKTCGYLVVLVAVLGGWACSPTYTETKSSSLPRYEKKEIRPLYRGLEGGMSLQQVGRIVCQRWAMQRCILRSVPIQSCPGLPGVRSFASDLTVYSWQSHEEMSCRSYFYFRRWGLLAVRVHCDASASESVRALIRRYHRWYQTPTQTYPQHMGQPHAWNQHRRTGRGYVWSQDRNRWRVSLHIRKLQSQAIHVDYRRRWYEIAANLEPSSSRSRPETLAVWNKTPLALRREILTTVAHLIDRLKHLHLHDPNYHLYTSPWSQDIDPDRCVPQPSTQAWQHHLWKTLQFEPPVSQQSLQYRIVHLYQRSRRRSFLPEKLYHVEVRGCGLSFAVPLRHIRGDWDYEPLFSTKKSSGVEVPTR